MITEKLYYTDAYISEFSARVLNCIPNDGGWLIELDKTAFFPEEGGQTADCGTVGVARIYDVKEVDGHIYHCSDLPLTVGEVLECHLDFAERLEKMKCHTAEHIVCGLFHNLYGYENVGFHLGHEDVTFDINAVVTREMLDDIEQRANIIVQQNIPVTAYFPTVEELRSMEYRAKLDLSKGVRIVMIGEYDSCACCAPHVAYTGEIGVIKLLDFEKHRGGTRIHMKAGLRAVQDYRSRYESVKRISELTCVPQGEVALAVERLCEQNDTLAREIKQQRLRFAAFEADRLAYTDGNAVCYFADFDMDALREFSKLATSRVGGILVAIGGCEGDIKYVISSSCINLRELSAEINRSLDGRGGGRAEMLQGSFACSIEKVRAYFIK